MFFNLMVQGLCRASLFAQILPQTKKTYTVNPRKLEHEFRRNGARIPYTLA